MKLSDTMAKGPTAFGKNPITSAPAPTGDANITNVLDGATPNQAPASGPLAKAPKANAAVIMLESALDSMHAEREARHASQMEMMQVARDLRGAVKALKVEEPDSPSLAGAEYQAARATAAAEAAREASKGLTARVSGLREAHAATFKFLNSANRQKKRFVDAPAKLPGSSLASIRDQIRANRHDEAGVINAAPPLAVARQSIVDEFRHYQRIGRPRAQIARHTNWRGLDRPDSVHVTADIQWTLADVLQDFAENISCGPLSHSNLGRARAYEAYHGGAELLAVLVKDIEEAYKKIPLSLTEKEKKLELSKLYDTRLELERAESALVWNLFASEGRPLDFTKDTNPLALLQIAVA